MRRFFSSIIYIAIILSVIYFWLPGELRNDADKLIAEIEKLGEEIFNDSTFNISIEINTNDKENDSIPEPIKSDSNKTKKPEVEDKTKYIIDEDGTRYVLE